jgi:hypothetical protein
MTHCVNNEVGHELESECRIVRRILRIIRPFEAVAKIRVPCHKDAYSAALIENGEHLWDPAGRTVFPLLALAAFRDSIAYVASQLLR